MEFFDLFIRARHTPLVFFPVRPVFTSHAYHSLGRGKSAHHSLFFAFFPHQASCLGLLFYFSAWRFNPQGAGLCCIFGLEYLFFPAAAAAASYHRRILRFALAFFSPSGFVRVVHNGHTSAAYQRISPLRDCVHKQGSKKYRHRIPKNIYLIIIEKALLL